MKIAAVGKAFPPHYYSQEELLEEFRVFWAEQRGNLGRFERLHRNVQVGGRHLALPLDEYRDLGGFGQSNKAWIRVAEDVGAAAITDALERCGKSPKDVDALFFVSVTGVATPSLDARLMNRLGLPSGVRRVPIFGLGCVAGAAGIARAADYVKAYPAQTAVLLSVELCSLTFQRKDVSIANVISSGLFGDGAAAVVVVGEEQEAAGPSIVATRSVFYSDTERIMGWDISEQGFQVILSAGVPSLVKEHLCADVDAFLADQGLSRDDIESWVAHPGGPRVLEAMQEALDLPEDALDETWRSLAEVGNLSSTSVLLVLEQRMTAKRPAPGSLGLLLALGPGFCSELVLLRW
jgi:alkylresorcinol/alkylpyrone synthase